MNINKQAKLIDGQALLESVNNRIEWFRARSKGWKDRGYETKAHGYYECSIALEEIKDEIQSGRFDALSDDRLRAALDEIKRLRENYRKLLTVNAGNYARACEYDGEIKRLREQVDSLLEEKEGWQVIADRGWHEAGEEVKKREELESQLQQLREELEQVKKELSEKDKVLEWYADEDTQEIKRRVLGDFAPISLDKGQRARDILAKYTLTERGDSLDER